MTEKNNEQTENRNAINKKSRRDWVDIGIKAFTPLMAGALIAWIGFVSNLTLSSVSSKQESARLITELQIRREQAESDLRKDVFDQALQAFLLKNAQNSQTIDGMSKQLLRLELLALNFGDSLSLSPLFSEFRKDLIRLRPDETADRTTFDDDKADLENRLLSLARRVASTQISSLAQHGVIKEISIPLTVYKKHRATVKYRDRCNKLMYPGGYAWPERLIQRQLDLYDEKADKLASNETIKAFFASDTDEAIDFETQYIASINDEREISLDNVDRYLDVTISDVDVCKERAFINIQVQKYDATKQQPVINHFEIRDSGDLTIASDYVLDKQQKQKYLGDAETSPAKLDISKYELKNVVSRRFKLDYFNFPMVDNTRLGANHRFAIVLDEVDTESDEPVIKLLGIIFPSEYASLRDRPGMKEARKLLESALKDKNKNRE